MYDILTIAVTYPSQTWQCAALREAEQRHPAEDQPREDDRVEWDTCEGVDHPEILYAPAEKVVTPCQSLVRGQAVQRTARHVKRRVAARQNTVEKEAIDEARKGTMAQNIDRVHHMNAGGMYGEDEGATNGRDDEHDGDGVEEVEEYREPVN